MMGLLGNLLESNEARHGVTARRRHQAPQWSDTPLKYHSYGSSRDNPISLDQVTLFIPPFTLPLSRRRVLPPDLWGEGPVSYAS